MPSKNKPKTNYDRYLDLKSSLPYDNVIEYDDSIDFFAIFELCQRCSMKNIGRRFSAVLYHKPKTIEEIIRVCETVKSFGRGVTKAALEYCYGAEDGLSRWNSYRETQAITNTFEYKSKKYGMSEQEFEAFNKSRAITEENLINRHGRERGLEIWNDYRERQAYTNTKEHLKDRYESINMKKAHTFDAYLLRYGDAETAKQKLHEYHSKRNDFYSKLSQSLFFELLKSPIFSNRKVYFAEYDGVYGVYSHSQNRYYKYDFVCPDLKLCIEFNGDHYHGNPKMYMPNDFLKGRGQSTKTAAEAWKSDELKQLAIFEERGYSTIIIWESDYITNNLETLNRVLEYAKNRI